MKKQQDLHKQKREAELEEFLFAGNAGDISGFGREDEEYNERLAVAQLIAKADAAHDREAEKQTFLIWEDRGGVTPAHAEDALSEDDELPEASAQEGEHSEASDSQEEGPPVRKVLLDQDIVATSDDEAPAEALALNADSEAHHRGAVAPGADVTQEDGSMVRSSRVPVWADEDDEQVQVDIAGRDRLRKLRQAEDDASISGKEYEARLRKQHSKLNPRTSWATEEGRSRKRRRAGYGEDSEDDEDAEALLASAGGLLARPAQLPPGLIETTRMRDANIAEPSKAVVQSIEFHPDGQVLMTAGMDKRLRFFQVDGARNPKIQSIYLDKFPIHQAAFAAGGTHVVASSRRRHFYTFDLASASVEKVAGLVGRPEKSLETFAACPAPDNPLVAFLGNEGCVPLVSLRSRQAVGDLKMSGAARTAAFSGDGRELLTSGSDGVVHVWDMRMRRCLSRNVDEGCFSSTALAASADSSLYATGSKSGVVNLYKYPHRDQGLHVGSSGPLLPTASSPAKTLMNLTTSVDTLAFSPDTQILAMASRMTKDALRLVHLPSYTVFSNWPTSRTPLGYVHSLAFSPGGGYLAIGTARGTALLYRLHALPV
ncbi:hypothetical protein CVIRNUC_005979 [Coccomyxa viridis]|uniref:U3 small nucleolar RNA-associated protein 18 homolog n=1 Tax=Coccomyxa viridis TaxID=1274662 RepID=A0AAV1I6T8_9CHLO|nr:hypothetical protein CVIRNUC_005979 [Coccomyxa viridis]